MRMFKDKALGKISGIDWVKPGEDVKKNWTLHLHNIRPSLQKFNQGERRGQNTQK